MQISLSVELSVFGFVFPIVLLLAKSVSSFIRRLNGFDFLNRNFSSTFFLVAF
jgi:hypothetical protein